MKGFKYTKEELRRILDLGLATGADFAELFFEDSYSINISMMDSKVKNANNGNIHGVGIRLCKGEQVVFANTNDFNKVEELVKNLAASFNGKREHNALPLVEKVNDHITECNIKPNEVSNEEKISILERMDKAARAVSSEVIQVMLRSGDKYQEVIVCNSNGLYASDVRCNIIIYCQCVASDGKETQTGTADIGHNAGYEYYYEQDKLGAFEQVATSAAKSAVAMVHAEYIKGGKMTVVIDNAFGGVILHEACVHGLEATSVAKNASVFCGKLGTKIASDIVNAVDDGTLPGYWGSYNMDDEGHKPQRNVLIENGILKSYLVDERNSKKMNHPTTGSGRRQNYTFLPTSRMTNTFFLNGKSTKEEIIEATEYGLYAKKMGGGSVDPSTGEFNFVVNEGYLIENGKITKAIKGATLVGSGKDVLLNIDMIANNLETGHGMCGSSSGSVPTDVGQPTIRVQNITVGGK